MTIKVTVPPATEPITLPEAKAQCRIDGTDEDTYVTGLISAARDYCEKRDWRAYLPQTIQLWLENWPADDEIELPRPPLRSVASVKYYDVNEVVYTLPTTVYAVDTISEPGSIHLKYQQVWPSILLRDYNAVVVEYSAGYADAASVPQTIKMAMKLLIGHWFENREATTVGAVSREIDFAVTSLINLDSAKHF